jgi:hypothetical protein
MLPPGSLFLDVKNNALIFGDQQIQQRWIIKSAERNEIGFISPAALRKQAILTALS